MATPSSMIDRRGFGATWDPPHSMVVAVDAFNALNHVNFQNYVGTLSSPFVGRANAAEPARQLQLSVRFIFWGSRSDRPLEGKQGQDQILDLWPVAGSASEI